MDDNAEQTSETSQGEEGTFGESEDDENDNKSGGQEKRECPLPSCDSKVVHIPRHLRNVHKWSEVHARTAVSRLGLRKKYEFSVEEKAKEGGILVLRKKVVERIEEIQTTFNLHDVWRVKNPQAKSFT